MVGTETGEESGEESSVACGGTEEDYYASASDTDSGGSEDGMYSDLSCVWSPEVQADSNTHSNNVRGGSHPPHPGVSTLPSNPSVEWRGETGIAGSLLTDIQDHYEQMPSENTAAQGSNCVQEKVDPFKSQVS